MCRSFIVVKLLLLKLLLASISGLIAATGYEFGYHPSAEEFDNLLRDTHTTWTHDILDKQTQRELYQRVPTNEVRSYVPKFQYKSHLNTFNKPNQKRHDLQEYPYDSVGSASGDAFTSTKKHSTLQNLGSTLDFHYINDISLNEDVGVDQQTDNFDSNSDKPQQLTTATTGASWPDINLKPLAKPEVEKYSLNNLYKKNSQAHFPIYFTNPATGIVYAIAEVGKSTTDNMKHTNGSIPIFITKEQYERDIFLLKQEYDSKCQIKDNNSNNKNTKKVTTSSSFSRPSKPTTTSTTTSRPQIIRLQKPLESTVSVSKLITPLRKPSSVVVRTELTVKDHKSTSTARPPLRKKRKPKNKKKVKKTKPPGHRKGNVTTPRPKLTVVEALSASGPHIVKGTRMTTPRPDSSELYKLSTQLEKPNFGTTIFSTGILPATVSNVGFSDKRPPFYNRERQKRSLDLKSYNNDEESLKYTNASRKSVINRTGITNNFDNLKDNDNRETKFGDKTEIFTKSRENTKNLQKSGSDQAEENFPYGLHLKNPESKIFYNIDNNEIKFANEKVNSAKNLEDKNIINEFKDYKTKQYFKPQYDMKNEKDNDNSERNPEDKKIINESKDYLTKLNLKLQSYMPHQARIGERNDNKKDIDKREIIFEIKPENVMPAKSDDYLTKQSVNHQNQDKFNIGNNKSENIDYSETKIEDKTQIFTKSNEQDLKYKSQSENQSKISKPSNNEKDIDNSEITFTNEKVNSAVNPNDNNIIITSKYFKTNPQNDMKNQSRISKVTDYKKYIDKREIDFENQPEIVALKKTDDYWTEQSIRHLEPYQNQDIFQKENKKSKNIDYSETKFKNVKNMLTKRNLNPEEKDIKNNSQFKNQAEISEFNDKSNHKMDSIEMEPISINEYNPSPFSFDEIKLKTDIQNHKIDELKKSELNINDKIEEFLKATEQLQQPTNFQATQDFENLNKYENVNVKLNFDNAQNFYKNNKIKSDIVSDIDKVQYKIEYDNDSSEQDMSNNVKDTENNYNDDNKSITNAENNYNDDNKSITNAVKYAENSVIDKTDKKLQQTKENLNKSYEFIVINDKPSTTITENNMKLNSAEKQKVQKDSESNTKHITEDIPSDDLIKSPFSYATHTGEKSSVEKNSHPKTITDKLDFYIEKLNKTNKNQSETRFERQIRHLMHNGNNITQFKDFEVSTGKVKITQDFYKEKNTNENTEDNFYKSNEQWLTFLEKLKNQKSKQLHPAENNSNFNDKTAKNLSEKANLGNNEYNLPFKISMSEISNNNKNVFNQNKSHSEKHRNDSVMSRHSEIVFNTIDNSSEGTTESISNTPFKYDNLTKFKAKPEKLLQKQSVRIQESPENRSITTEISVPEIYNKIQNNSDLKIYPISTVVSRHSESNINAIDNSKETSAESNIMNSFKYENHTKSNAEPDKLVQKQSRTIQQSQEYRPITPEDINEKSSKHNTLLNEQTSFELKQKIAKNQNQDIKPIYSKNKLPNVHDNRLISTNNMIDKVEYKNRLLKSAIMTDKNLNQDLKLSYSKDKLSNVHDNIPITTISIADNVKNTINNRLIKSVIKMDENFNDVSTPNLNKDKLQNIDHTTPITLESTMNQQASKIINAIEESFIKSPTKTNKISSKYDKLNYSNEKFQHNEYKRSITKDSNYYEATTKNMISNQIPLNKSHIQTDQYLSSAKSLNHSKDAIKTNAKNLSLSEGRPTKKFLNIYSSNKTTNLQDLINNLNILLHSKNSTNMLNNANSKYQVKDGNLSIITSGYYKQREQQYIGLAEANVKQSLNKVNHFIRKQGNLQHESKDTIKLIDDNSIETTDTVSYPNIQNEELMPLESPVNIFSEQQISVDNTQQIHQNVMSEQSITLSNLVKPLTKSKTSEVNENLINFTPHNVDEKSNHLAKPFKSQHKHESSFDYKKPSGLIRPVKNNLGSKTFLKPNVLKKIEIDKNLHHIQKRSTDIQKQNMTAPKFFKKHLNETLRQLPKNDINQIQQRAQNTTEEKPSLFTQPSRLLNTFPLDSRRTNSKHTNSLHKSSSVKKRKRKHHRTNSGLSANRTKSIKKKRKRIQPSTVKIHVEQTPFNNTTNSTKSESSTARTINITINNKRPKINSANNKNEELHVEDIKEAKAKYEPNSEQKTKDDDDEDEDGDDDSEEDNENVKNVDDDDDDDEDDDDDDDDDEDDGDEDDLKEVSIHDNTSSAEEGADFGALEEPDPPAEDKTNPTLEYKNPSPPPAEDIKKRIRRRPANDYDDDDEDDDLGEDSAMGTNFGGFFRMIFYPVQMVMSSIMDTFMGGKDQEEEAVYTYPQYTSYHNTLKQHSSNDDYSYYDDEEDDDEEGGGGESSLTGWLSSWFGFNRRNKKIGSTTVAPQAAVRRPTKSSSGWLQSWFGIGGNDGVDKMDTPDDYDDYDKWFASWFGKIRPKARKRATTTTTSTTTQLPQVPILTIVDPMRNPQNWIGILAHHIINQTSTTTQNPLKEIWSRMTTPATTTTTTENPEIPRKISYNKYQIWRLKPQDDAQVQALEEYKKGDDGIKLQWLKGPSLRGLTDVLVPPRMLVDFQASLTFESIDHEVLIFDVGKAIAYEKSKEDHFFTTTQKPKKQNRYPNKPQTAMTWMRYYEFDDIVTYMESMRLRYPQLVELIHIGRSYEGRPLIVMKIESKEAAATNSAQYAEHEKAKLRHKKRIGLANAVFIEAGTHGMEWIAPATATWIINELLKIMKTNKTSSDEANLIRNTTWFMMPVLNPDGYVYSHEYDRFWKKSRSRHISRPSGLINSAMTWLQKKRIKDKVCFGVDLDRNWNYQWGKRGSSKSPCNEFFAGPGPFSEPETKALSEFLMNYRTHIKLYISMQAYGQIISYPYKANTTYDTERLDDFLDVAMVGTDGLRKKGSKSRYKIDSTNDLVENRSGCSDAFVAYDVGIPFSYTMQLADNGVHGYLLPSSSIESTSRDAFEIVTAMLDYI